MNQVISGLYISGIHEVREGNWVVLRLCEQRPDYPSLTGIHHINFPMPDGAGFMVQYLELSDETIRIHRERDIPVVVTCAAGKSRSAVVIMSYLVSQGMTLKEAYELVKKARPQIDPNFHLLIALCEHHKLPTVLSSLGL